MSPVQQIHTGDIQNLAVTNPKLAGLNWRNVDLGSDSHRYNLLPNGGFRVTSRGTSFSSPVSGTMTADKWLVFFNAGSVTAISLGSVYSPYGVNIAGVSGTYVYSSGQQNFYTRVVFSEGNLYNLRGKQVTFACYIASQQANAVSLWIQSDGTGGVNAIGTAVPGDNTWRRLSLTSAALPSDCTYVQCGLWFTGSCTWSMTECTLVPGTQAADYIPLHWADDRARCADTAWILPTFTNSWAAYSGGANYGAQCGYRKMQDGRVIFRGIITGGTQNNPIFTLPVGYRPIAEMLFVVAMNAGATRITINPTGTVIPAEVLAGTWNNGWISLNELSFFAEQ